MAYRSMVELIIDHISELPVNFTGVAISSGRNYFSYYLNGNPHRTDGPARFWKDLQAKNVLYVEFWLKGNYYKPAEKWFEALSEDEKILALFNADEWRNKTV